MGRTFGYKYSADTFFKSDTSVNRPVSFEYAVNSFNRVCHSLAACLKSQDKDCKPESLNSAIRDDSIVGLSGKGQIHSVPQQD